MPNPPCANCGVRQRQDGRLCRSCARLAGDEITPAIEKERKRVAAAEAKINALRPPPPGDEPPKVVIDRDPFTGKIVEYEVWDGRGWSWERGK